MLSKDLLLWAPQSPSNPSWYSLAVTADTSMSCVLCSGWHRDIQRRLYLGPGQEGVASFPEIFGVGSQAHGPPAPCLSQCVLGQNCFYSVASPPSHSDHLQNHIGMQRELRTWILMSHFRAAGLLSTQSFLSHAQSLQFISQDTRNLAVKLEVTILCWILKEEEQELVSHQSVKDQHSALTEHRCMDQCWQWGCFGC